MSIFVLRTWRLGEGMRAKILYLSRVRADGGSDGTVRLRYFISKAGRTAGQDGLNGRSRMRMSKWDHVMKYLRKGIFRGLH